MQECIDWDDFRVLYEPLVIAEKGTVPPEFLSLLDHREQGFQYQALDDLWKLSLTQNLQDLIHARLLFEINKYSKSKKLLVNLKSSTKFIELIEFELWFHEFDPASLEQSYIGFRQLLAKSQISNFLAEAFSDTLGSEITVKSEGTLELLLRVLIARRCLKYAQDVIKNYQSCLELSFGENSELGEYKIPVWIEALKADLYKRSWPDLYFDYYGILIMLIQAGIGVSLITLTSYHMIYNYSSNIYYLLSCLTGFEILDTQMFRDSMAKLVKVLLIYIALIPFTFVNLRMMFARFRRRLDCYTELFPGFAKVTQFGIAFHIKVDDEDKPLFLYLDDNDFNFVGMIRHFPLVPNFTYAYGLDCLRNSYINVPLFGFADGYLFQERLLRVNSCKVEPLNMLGVRTVQFFSFLDRIPPVARQALFFSVLLVWISVSQFLAQTGNSILFFQLVGSFWILFWVYYDQIEDSYREWMCSFKVSKILQIPVLRFGITILAA